MAGCGADLLINVLLTIWLYVLSASRSLTNELVQLTNQTSWVPGVIHAFYLLFVYYDRRDKYKIGAPPLTRAPFVYSDKVQSGGLVYGRV
jgi:uncharacterized membrane protein YqaE (UPF0057 family)